MTPEAMAEIVSQAIEMAVSPLVARIKSLEAVAAIPGPAGPMGPQGERGVDGKDGAAGLDGKDGRDGIDGKDGAPGPAGQKGLDGKDGRDGTPGLNGKDGRDGVDGKDGAPGLNGKDGVDGLNGKDGAPGPRGEKGADGLAGKVGESGPRGEKGLDGSDGVGVADTLIDHQGHLVVTFTNGLTKTLGAVVGKDGAPGLNGKDADNATILKALSDEIGSWPRPLNGKDGRDGLDGKDGLGFDGFDIVLDEQKGFLGRWSNAERTLEKQLPFPWHAGVWQPGRSYPRGATVLDKGSTWAAQAETKGVRPSDETSGSGRVWVLTCKRGRDGKDGKDGLSGESA